MLDELGYNLPMSRRTTLLFDFDGTLVNSLDQSLEILRSIAKRHGFRTITDEDVLTIRGGTIRDAFKYMQVPFYKLPILLLEGQRELRNRVSALRPFSGMTEVLQKLKTENMSLAIVTSNDEHVVKDFLDRHQWDMFDYVQAGVNLFGKAHVIRNLLKKYKVSPESVLYIGDEIRDIEAARSVGIPIISVTWGFNTRDALARYKPDYLIDTPRELLLHINSKL